MVYFPSTKQPCQPQSETLLVLISEKQSLQSLWNHQVGHSTVVPYLSWSWWAILSLSSFSSLRAVAMYIASLSCVPKKFDMPLISLGLGGGLLLLSMLQYHHLHQCHHCPSPVASHKTIFCNWHLSTFKLLVGVSSKTGWSYYNKCVIFFSLLSQ